jgi:hypothetical protein
MAQVAEAVDRFHAGDLDASAVDQVMFQYSRAARQLWNYSNLTEVEMTARHLNQDPSIDWWERGAP